MRGTLVVLVSVLSVATAVAGVPSKTTVERIDHAAKVVHELRATADKGIPEHVWERARCVAVMPGVKKAAVVVGGEYGRGIVSCRNAGGWTAPVFLTLEKGSLGAQIGGESSDLVLLVMNERGVDRLLQDKATLGTDMSVAAGPVGHGDPAGADKTQAAEMLTYSHARGLFAGIDISGGVLRPDKDANSKFYGHQVSERSVLLGTQHVITPDAATPFMSALKNPTPHPASHATPHKS